MTATPFTTNTITFFQARLPPFLSVCDISSACPELSVARGSARSAACDSLRPLFHLDLASSILFAVSNFFGYPDGYPDIIFIPVPRYHQTVQYCLKALSEANKVLVL